MFGIGDTELLIRIGVHNELVEYELIVLINFEWYLGAFRFDFMSKESLNISLTLVDILPVTSSPETFFKLLLENFPCFSGDFLEEFVDAW